MDVKKSHYMNPEQVGTLKLLLMFLNPVENRTRLFSFCVCVSEAGNMKLLQGLMACELLGQEGQMETLEQCARCVPRRVQQVSTDQINLQKLGCLCHLN